MEVNLKQTTNSSSISPNVTSVLTDGSLQFKILLLLGIPSFICYIFIIVYMLAHKNHRTAPHNYCLLIILNLQLFCNLVDIPSQVYFYWNLRVMFENAIYCYAWQYISYSTWPISLIVLMWASVERHILIFHDQFLRSKWRNFFLHFAPPIGIIVYATCFHIYIFTFYTCKNPYLFNMNHCGNPCYTGDIRIMTWMRVAHYMFPSILTSILSIWLLIRVIYSKRRHQQIFFWRKHKRLTYQLLTLATLNVLTVFPYSIVRLIGTVNANVVSRPVQDLFGFISLLEPLYFPFVYLASMAEIWTTMRTALRRITARQIVPVSFSHT